MKIQMQQQQMMNSVQQPQPQSQPEQQNQQQNENQDLENEINKLALSALKMSPEERKVIFSKLDGRVKQMFEQKLKELEEAYKQQEVQKNTQADMRPMPDQKPPRRDSVTG